MALHQQTERADLILYSQPLLPQVVATEDDITALLVLAVDRVAVVAQAPPVLAVAQEILHQHLPLKVATEEQAGRLLQSMLAAEVVVRQQAVVLVMEPLE